MKPTSTALVLSIAVLGQCDAQDATTTPCTQYETGSVQPSIDSTTTTSTSCTSAQYRPSAGPHAETYTSSFAEYASYAAPNIETRCRSTSCTSMNSEPSSAVVPTIAATVATYTSVSHGPPVAWPLDTSSQDHSTQKVPSSKPTTSQHGTAMHVLLGPAGTASANRTHSPSPNFPMTNSTNTLPGASATGLPSFIGGTNTTNSTATSTRSSTGKNVTSHAATARPSLTGGANATNETAAAFGLEVLRTLLDGLPYARWSWPRLKHPGRQETDPTDEFNDVVCTGNLIDAFDERRASRHLEYFCNRWPMPRERLFASTSGKTTLYMCPYGSLGGARNCSLDLWRAASAHLDIKCGLGTTGYVHLRKMRIGRESLASGATLCSRLLWEPLLEYRIAQRREQILVDGRPYEEWQILNRRKQMREELEPDINERNDADAMPS